ncbi:hypothetical protein J3D54_005515 [Pseudomonas sp. GGS8]|uniref:hypothetical protein n=1 Tax=Pseudomonas sp. GGS8 TaxID=2817892 RepID=UPI00209FA767|nr:hypothetical protein [Pseudomonas sp. GGS8]MCP1446383.1 hypothetical protein [Pseudomonas sp. GGS8]
MSQHDLTVDNGPGLTFRSDMNAALQALASQSSGAAAPSPTFPCQMWADTGTGRLRQRNSANTAWVDRGALDVVSFLSLTGGTLSGAVNDAPIQTIASATLTDIGAATSNVVAISGTTAIASLGLISAGARRTVQFLGALVLTHNATSLILPGNANITTAAGDTAEFLSLGGGNWICLDYTYRLVGKPLDAALADFAIIYPNGGTQASPANAAANSRYSSPNPFPGFRVFCVAQVKYTNGFWGAPNWASWYDPSFNFSTFGLVCSQLNDDVLITISGKQGVMTGDDHLNPHPFGAVTNQATLPCRVLVWKLKGAV